MALLDLLNSAAHATGRWFICLFTRIPVFFKHTANSQAPTWSPYGKASPLSWCLQAPNPLCTYCACNDKEVEEKCAVPPAWSSVHHIVLDEIIRLINSTHVLVVLQDWNKQEMSTTLKISFLSLNFLLTVSPAYAGWILEHTDTSLVPIYFTKTVESCLIHQTVPQVHCKKWLWNTQ